MINAQVSLIRALRLQPSVVHAYAAWFIVEMYPFDRSLPTPNPGKHDHDFNMSWCVSCVVSYTLACVIPQTGLEFFYNKPFFDTKKKFTLALDTSLPRCAGGVGWDSGWTQPAASGPARPSPPLLFS